MPVKDLADKWLTKDGLKQIEEWAETGIIDTQLASNMKISIPTLYRWKKKYPEIKEVLDNGKVVADIQVENALFKRALGYNVRIIKEKMDKFGDVHEIEEEMHIAGDVTAQIFWLKNRRPQEWREKQEVNDKEVLEKLDDLLEAQKNA